MNYYSVKPLGLAAILVLTATPAWSQEQIDEQQAEVVETQAKEIEVLAKELETTTDKGKVEELAKEIEAKAEAIDAEEKVWSGSIELGYSDSSGNTVERTVKSKMDINREKGDWRYNLQVNSMNTKSKGQRTAEKYFASNRLAYAFTENNYAFLFASYDDERFSGFDYQATVAAGYGRRILNMDVMEWDIEFGPGYREAEPENGANTLSEAEAIWRLFSKYSWDLTPTSKFSQELSTEAGDDNTISKSITALTMQIIGSLAMKTSYTVKYTEQVPAGKHKKDTETSVTLLYSF